MSPQRLIARLLNGESLTERQYTLPSNGDTLLFDLHGLYAAWVQLGSGQEEYGQPVTRVTNETRRKLIDRTFTECAVDTAHLLVRECTAALMDELENMTDEYLIPTEVVGAWLWEHLPRDVAIKFFVSDDMADLVVRADAGDPAAFDDVFIVLPDSFAEIGYHLALRIFGAPWWAKHADMYGGEKWVKITEAVMQLHDAIKRGKSPKDLMFFIDRLYDLEHNTGALVGKLGSLARVSKKALDTRAELRTPKDFARFCSPMVRNILTAMPESRTLAARLAG